MKQKRTLDEAFALFKKGNLDPKAKDFFDQLTEDPERSNSRVDDLGICNDFAKVLGIDDFVRKAILFPATLGTCIDIGIVIGRLLYEDLPGEESSKETKKNVHLLN